MPVNGRNASHKYDWSGQTKGLHKVAAECWASSIFVGAYAITFSFPTGPILIRQTKTKGTYIGPGGKERKNSVRLIILFFLYSLFQLSHTKDIKVIDAEL